MNLLSHLLLGDHPERQHNLPSSLQMLDPTLVIFTSGCFFILCRACSTILHSFTSCPEAQSTYPFTYSGVQIIVRLISPKEVGNHGWTTGKFRVVNQVAP